MSETLTLWTDFTKRENSTKQPTGGTDFEVVLKDGTTLFNPTFTINTSEIDWTYAKYHGRYYFVTNVEPRRNNYVDIMCREDCLATRKSNILATSAYVLYSTSGGSSRILDTRITQNCTMTMNEKSVDINIGNVIEGGYALSVVGDSGSVTFSVHGYTLAALATAIGTLSEEQISVFSLTYGSVFDCVKSCTAIPFGVASGTRGNITLGTFDTGLSGVILTPTNCVDVTDYTLTIPWIHDYGNPRRMKEAVYLYLPAIGTVQMDVAQIYNTDVISIRVNRDYITGYLTYTVETSTGLPLYYSASLGTDVQFGVAYQSGISGLVGRAMGGIMSTSSTEANVSYVGNLVDISASDLKMKGRTGTRSTWSAIYNTLGLTSQSIGTQGGYANVRQALQESSAKIFNYSYLYSESQSSMATSFGLPCYEIKTLSSLSGYCQCAGASVEGSMYDVERETINSFLNEGFFIE